MSHGYVDPCLRRLTQFFVVFAQTTTPAEPCECSLDHPSARQHIELATVPWTLDDFKRPSCQAPYPLDQLSPIARVSPDQAQTLEPTFQFADNQLRSISVLNVRRMNHHIQQQSCGIHYDVSLPTIYLFARVVAARAPFSVVLTDWLSMIAALGVVLLPSDSRTAGATPHALAPMFRPASIRGNICTLFAKGEDHSEAYARRIRSEACTGYR